MRGNTVQQATITPTTRLALEALYALLVLTVESINRDPIERVLLENSVYSALLSALAQTARALGKEYPFAARKGHSQKTIDVIQ